MKWFSGGIGRVCGALLLVWAVWASCRTRPASATAPFRQAKLAEIDHAMFQAVAERRIPGGVYWLEREGNAYVKAYGNRMVEPLVKPMLPDTIFDLASLTKVIATTPSIMILVERGKLDLLKPAADYIPEFGTHGKQTIIVRQLLTHTSGLPPDLDLKAPWAGYDQAIALACAEKPAAPPDTVFRYSDINFIILGELVRRISGRPLDEFAAAHIFQPLGMSDTGFRPPLSKYPRIAPTERIGGEVLLGVAHDPTARRMGGVAGHAGLFSTAADLARFARMLLNGGSLQGARVLSRQMVELMTRVATPENLPIRRGLGWDIDSPYASPRGELFPIGSYGHTGWTGTSLWIDPFSRTFWILLSNRNHPSESASLGDLRYRLGTLSAEAVAGFNFLDVPGALAPKSQTAASPMQIRENELPHNGATNSVLEGIDVLEKEDFQPLRKLKIGLITNQSGVDRQRNSTIDLLAKAPDVQLKALFSPEHGIRGVKDELVPDSVDEKTGLPIYSLYSARRQPTPDEVRGLDALVFDIRDVGCRFYTYIATMGMAMQAAAEAHLKFFVLDRVDPINGVQVEGPIYHGPSSFTAFHPLPVRDGMTMGELARLFKEELRLNLDLTIVPLEGWRRGMLFDQTALPWVNPSPNIRSLNEALLYPGIGLLETTALSVGRGADTPFEIVGAPYIDDLLLARELRNAQLPGVRFVPVRFTPRSNIFKGEECRGVRIELIDRRRPIVDLGIILAETLERLYPTKFQVERMNVLLQDTPTMNAIRAGEPLDRIKGRWEQGLKEFEARRQQALLYQ